jgi:hypothetical protein
MLILLRVTIDPDTASTCHTTVREIVTVAVLRPLLMLLLLLLLLLVVSQTKIASCKLEQDRVELPG